MMKKYYYAGLTCPSCRYPFRNDNLADAIPFEQLKDNFFLCPRCGAEFVNKVNREIFTEQVTRSLPFSDEADSPVPLYRECVPGKIEEAYIKWFSEFPSGIHLITWPWKEVRFIPVAVSELLEKHPDKKIVVTGSFKKSDDNSVGNPVKLISELFSITVPEDTENAKSGYLLPKPDRLKQQLFHKYEKEIEIRIQPGRSASGPSYQILRYEQGRLATVRKNTLRTLRDEYGEDWRGCAVSPEPEKPVPSEKLSGDKLEKKLREYNELMELIHPDVSGSENSAPLKVTFRETYGRYAGSDVKYNRQWMNDVVKNADNVKYYHDISKIYASSDDFPDSLTRPLTYIIPDSNDYKYPSEFFEKIKSLHPDILILTDTDRFLTYSSYGFASVNPRLPRIMKSCGVPVIMFSTDPESRQYYHFDNPEKRFGNNEITIHSVDSKPVLRSMLPSEEKNATPYSPFFSYSKKAKYEPKIPFEFIHYDGVDVTVLIEKIRKLPEKEFALKLEKYVYAALLSPVYINDLEEEDHTLSVWQNGTALSYRECLNLLDEKVYADESYEDVLTTFEETFRIFEDRKNPLRDMFVKTAGDLCSEDKSCKILFAVSPYEIKSLEWIVRNDDCFSETRKFISVVSWKNLESHLRNNQRMSGQEQRIYVVSAHHPTQYFHFNQNSLSAISRIIFIADSGKEKRIRNVIEKRLIDDSVIRPVISPGSPESAPDFLNSVIQTLSDDDLCTSKAEELAEALVDEDEVYYRSNGKHSEYITPTQDSSGEFGVKLKEGETVLLARNDAGEGVFLGLDSSVLVKTDIPFEEWNLKSFKKHGHGKLEGADLILSISSYKKIFSKHMLEHHAEFQARYGTYEWKLFEDLYMDSTLWIRFIDSAIESFMKYCDISRKTAKNAIIELLSAESGKDQMTIRSWLREEEMETSAGVYSLYPIEHPRSLGDVLKIHSVLSEKYVPDITAEDMERSFCAARYIQTLRGDVRKISPKDSATVIKIREELHAVWNDILCDAYIFTPVSVEKCTLDKAVYAKKVYNEYIDYIRN